MRVALGIAATIGLVHSNCLLAQALEIGCRVMIGHGLEAGCGPVLSGRKLKGEVEFGGIVGKGFQVRFQFGEIQLRRGFLENGHALEEGRDAFLTRGVQGLHDVLKGHLTVLMGKDGLLAGLLQQRFKSHGWLQVQGNGQGIEEETHHLLCLGLQALCKRGAHQKLTLLRVMME